MYPQFLVNLLSARFKLVVILAIKFILISMSCESYCRYAIRLLERLNNKIALFIYYARNNDINFYLFFTIFFILTLILIYKCVY